MRISDWSSDVCSSDLSGFWLRFRAVFGRKRRWDRGRGAPMNRTPANMQARDFSTWFRWITPRAMSSWSIVCGANSSEDRGSRSEEHTSELQSLMRISYAVLCLKKKKTTKDQEHHILYTKRK